MDRFIQYLGAHPYLAAATVAVAVLAIVLELRSRQSSFMAVGPQDAVRLMNQNALVLDLRPAEAFAAGHLAGARNLPPDQILNAGETLKKYKEKPVVVYDESGSLGVSAGRPVAGRGVPKPGTL